METSPALTEKGFLRPTYDEILNRKILHAKELFGEDIDTSEQTPLGKFIRINAFDLSKAYEELEIAYYSRFPNTASGQSLDRLLPFAGITRNPATAARHIVTLTGTPGFVVEAGFLVRTQSGVDFYVFDEITLGEDGAAQCMVECTQRGRIGNVPIGSITDIVNPSMDVLEVKHDDIESLGEEAETDYEVRKRFTQTISGAGSSTADSIIGAIMRIRGVKGVLIDENDSDSTNDRGVPRRSFETFVLAPKDLAKSIAEAIFSKKPLGIKTYGDNEVEVFDVGGHSHTVRFSWTREIDLMLKIKVKVDNFFESDGEQQIISNIVEYFATLVNGQTVVLTSLYGYIYQISGVVQVTELLMSKDGGTTFTTDDVSCTFDEVPNLSAESILLEVMRFEK